ncbi:MAG: hypothetical protein QG629_447, partial [Patescibacteria group bacterium]|nr:hypothetical protein [Patescibacteria group bacterium]
MSYAINLKKNATELQDYSAKQVLRQAFS